MSTTSAEADSILGDVVDLLKSRVGLALKEHKERARVDIAQSTSVVEALRREIDANSETLRNAEREAEHLRADLETSRLKIERLESSVKRQREHTETARQEAQQWKSQVTRLQEQFSQEQETNMQEIDKWKDRYRQAEKARLAATAQRDELLIKRRKRTPSLNRAVEYSASASSSQTKASGRHYRDEDLSPTAVSDEEPRHTTKRRRKDTPERSRGRGEDARSLGISHPPKRNRRTSGQYQPDYDEEEPSLVRPMRQPKYSAPPRTPDPVRPPEVIRRVHAVISVPIKHEDEDDNYALGVESGGLFDSGGTPAPDAKPRIKSGRLIKKVPPPIHSGRASMPAYTPSREQDMVSDDESETNSDFPENHDDQDYREPDEDSRGRRKTPKSSARGPRHAMTDDNDPLLLRSTSDEPRKTAHGRSRKSTSRRR